MMVRKCAKRGCEEIYNPLQEHHLIPKGGWEGTDKDGRIILCKHHHNILANVLLAHVGKELKVKNEEIWKAIRDNFKSFTEWWLEYGSP